MQIPLPIRCCVVHHGRDSTVLIFSIYPTAHWYRIRYSIKVYSKVIQAIHPSHLCKHAVVWEQETLANPCNIAMQNVQTEKFSTKHSLYPHFQKGIHKFQSNHVIRMYDSIKKDHGFQKPRQVYCLLFKLERLLTGRPWVCDVVSAPLALSEDTTSVAWFLDLFRLHNCKCWLRI